MDEFCPNCSRLLMPFQPDGYDDCIESYCPNTDCEYATVYDWRFLQALKTYRYSENYDPNQWGFYFEGKRDLWKPDKVNINTNQITELTVKPNEKIEEIQKPKFYKLELDNIIGYPQIKDRLRDIVNSSKPVHFLMIGAPSVAKTVFLESMEKELKPQGMICHYLDCSTLTKSGLGDYLQEHQQELSNGLLMTDEIDSIDKFQQKAFLNLLSRGIWQTTNSRKRVKIDVKNMKVIATCNRADRIIEALRSRFMTVYLPAYTKEEYINVCILMLQMKYKYIDEKLAKYIAEQTANLEPRYIRNADRVGILCKHRPSFQYIDEIIATMEEYKIPDDINEGLDVQA